MRPAALLLFLLATALLSLWLLSARTPRGTLFASDSSRVGPARSGRDTCYRAWTQAALVDAAAIHASRAGKYQRPYMRYIDLHAVPPERREHALRVLGFALNSLSTNDQIVLPQTVPGTEWALAWVDLSTLRLKKDEAGLVKLVKAFDRLGRLGSGPAPFPEPYYHVVTVQETVNRTYWPGGYEGGTYYEKGWYRERTRRRVVALGPHLNRATAAGLAATVESNFPVYEYRWFLSNALAEPRYHELLGLGDSLKDVQRLAAVDERTADRVGAQVRGAVLFSEVAHRNRVLERTPTLLRYGRGSYQESLDFKTSVELQDVLKDLLVEKVDAHEIIWSLPNGLLGYFVTDGKGKRLDKADGDIAANRRSKFRDTQVRTAYHCIACHLPERGWIEVDDEVREMARRPVTLAVDAYAKWDHKRADRVRQKYLGADYNELLRADQAVVEVAVRAATARPGDSRGLTCPETAKLLVDAIWGYMEQPVDLKQLAVELGYPLATVAHAARTAGLDHPYPGLLAGRKQRRDQIEASFGQLATVLYQKYYHAGGK